LAILEGKNIVIDFPLGRKWWTDLRELAAELVRENVDVIFRDGLQPRSMSPEQVTTTIPIVFSTHFDPVGHPVMCRASRDPAANINRVWPALQTEFTGKVTGDADAKPRRTQKR